MVVTAVIAILSTLALAAVLVFVFVDEDPSPPPTTSTTTTSIPVEPRDEANEQWQSFSASFLQSHTNQPFESDGQIYAIATVDDVSSPPAESASISGLVLLGWDGDQWTSVDGIPWSNSRSELQIEVLGDRLVDHPMILISGCCPEESAYVFRIFDDELRDIVTDLPIDESWTQLKLTDRSFDFLEYTECIEGEQITTADGESTFFCDVERRTRLDILSDETIRISNEDVPHDRPPLLYPNDLGIAGALMTQPECDGSYVTAVGASISGSQAQNRANISRLLTKYPGALYLRNDQTCGSLWPSIEGHPVYLVYFGPFATKAEACDARSSGPDDAYVRPLDESTSHHTRVFC
jgi:hypothetical protein